MDIEKRITVGPTHTDSYNIVHHPQYFVWIEEGIMEWLISTYGGMDGICYEISKFHCKFLSPGILYDSLLVRVIPKGRKGAQGEETVKFQGKILKDNTKAPVMEGEFVVKIKEITE